MSFHYREVDHHKPSLTTFDHVVTPLYIVHHLVSRSMPPWFSCARLEGDNMEFISTLGTIKTKFVMHNMISRRCIPPAAKVEDSLNTSRAFNSFQQHFFIIKAKIINKNMLRWVHEVLIRVHNMYSKTWFQDNEEYFT